MRNTRRKPRPRDEDGSTLLGPERPVAFLQQGKRGDIRPLRGAGDRSLPNHPAQAIGYLIGLWLSLELLIPLVSGRG